MLAAPWSLRDSESEAALPASPARRFAADEAAAVIPARKAVLASLHSFEPAARSLKPHSSKLWAGEGPRTGRPWPALG